MDFGVGAQNVLFTPLRATGDAVGLSTAFVAADVAVLLLLLAFGLNLWLRRATYRVASLSDASPIAKVGGITIFIFKTIRLASLVALLSLSVATSLKNGWDRLNVVVTEAVVIAVIMATVNLLVPARMSQTVSPHLGLVTFVIFVFYMYRDIWPLMTFTLRPPDEREGTLLWIKVALATWAGLLGPLVEPFPYIPLHPEDPNATANPEQTASILAFISFIFLDPTIWLANGLPHLAHDQLPPLADYDEAHYLIEQHYKLLDPLSGAKKGSMVWAVLKVLRFPLCIQTIFTILTALFRLASPVGVNRLLNYLETEGVGAFVKPWVWILWIAFGPLGTTLSNELFLFFSTRSLVRVEGLLTTLIFDHAMRLRVKAEASERPAAGDDQNDGPPAADKGGNFVGKIMNMATADLNNITGGRNFLTLIFGAPLEVLLSMWFLYVILGWSSLVGLAVMVVLLPVPKRIAGLMSGIQKEKMKATDARVGVVTEMMNILRMVKLFGWEKRVQEDVAAKREVELQWVWKRTLYELVNSNVNQIIPLLHMIITYATYTLIMKRNLTASVVFSSITAFTNIRNELMWVSSYTPSLIASYVSLGRLGDFLWTTELLDTFDEKTEVTVDATVAAHDQDIGFGKAEFSWTIQLDTADNSEQVFRLHIEDDIIFEKGVLNLIYGPTACGKTSMLMALLGEMHYIPHGSDSWVNLPRSGGVAYASQESWVLSDTIKENILFGSPYDEERYNQVIYQCALTQDLQMFDSGDNTQVGEKGITLSGGQKARVTLARAVYSSAEIVLLDDILAALDVHTAQWVTSRCLGGSLLQGRTVILVTHRVMFVAPLTKFVISMVNGGIENKGSAVEILGMTPEAAQDIIAGQLETLDRKKGGDDIKAALPSLKEGKLVISEEIALGRVSWNAYKLFLGNLGVGGILSFLFWTQYLGSLGILQLCEIFQLWWLGHWADQYILRDPGSVSVFFYLGVFGLFILGSIAVQIYRTIIYALGSIRAARIIHNKLIVSVVGSTFRWLDVTPTSRVIIRCTQDIQAVDGPTPRAVDVVLSVALNMISKLGAVVIYTPIFLMPAVVGVSIGFWLGTVYIKAQMSIKRDMSNRKAPVLAMFGSAIHGLISIRAYGAQVSFREQLLKRINDYTRAGRMFWCMNRWVAVRLDSISTLFAGAIAFYFVYFDSSTSPAGVGFVITMAVSFTKSVMNFVHWYNNLEVNANSLERLHQYIGIDQEPKDGTEPPAYWPSSGNLHVKRLSASYTIDGPKVLQDLSFDVKSGERIGVVGRTGAGKSSLTLALLRCIPTEGLVTYDGVPTNTITLDALRSHITIIPQMPELISGSLRHNLDPFEQYDDATLNDALHSAGLFSLQQQGDESSRLTLDAMVAGGGANLSVGQRQIIALARAIVRQSKLLILDEATSAIDYDTDAVIQQSLRQELKSDVTVITVAHRLQTIMDYDKIMVLDSGRLVEFDTPKILLQKRYGLFRAMVEQSADKDELYAVVNRE